MICPGVSGYMLGCSLYVKRPEAQNDLFRRSFTLQPGEIMPYMATESVVFLDCFTK